MSLRRSVRRAGAVGGTSLVVVFLGCQGGPAESGMGDDSSGGGTAAEQGGRAAAAAGGRRVAGAGGAGGSAGSGVSSTRGERGGDGGGAASASGGRSGSDRGAAGAGTGRGGRPGGAGGDGEVSNTAGAVGGGGKSGSGGAKPGAAGASDDAGAPRPDGSAGGRKADSGAGGARVADASSGSDATAAVTCPTTALSAGDTNGSLQVGGANRTYILHVPKGYTGRTAVPLVVDFHGLGSSGSGEASASGYKALSDQEGFLVAYPNGIDNAWNIGPCCTTSRTVDDLGFVKALVAKIESSACVDPKRVYAAGFSMGGGISHYLACNAADVFAAVAPSAFDLLQDTEEPCQPSRPITEISFRGTSDPIVPYSGGASNPPNGLNVTIHFLGAQATFQKWAQLDGCTGTPSAADSSGCSTYSQCKDGVEVTLCTKQGGGHEPGSAQVGWAMLKKHSMP